MYFLIAFMKDFEILDLFFPTRAKILSKLLVFPEALSMKLQKMPKSYQSGKDVGNWEDSHLDVLTTDFRGFFPSHFSHNVPSTSAIRISHFWFYDANLYKESDGQSQIRWNIFGCSYYPVILLKTDFFRLQLSMGWKRKLFWLWFFEIDIFGFTKPSFITFNCNTGTSLKFKVKPRFFQIFAIHFFVLIQNMLCEFFTLNSRQKFIIHRNLMKFLQHM